MKRILLINDLVNCGGTERQHWMEFKALRQDGYDVYSLTFDPEEALVTEGHKINYPIPQSDGDKALSRLFVLPKYRFIHSLISQLKPDYIHLNNTFKIPITVFDAIRPYKNVQTARDYGIICPKSTCVHPDYSACRGYTHDNCIKCSLSFSEFIKYITLRRINHIRTRSCNTIVAPSQALASACVDNGIACGCINDMFDFTAVPQIQASRVEDVTAKQFLYLGAIGERKGIRPLIETFSSLPNDGTWNLVIAGNLEQAFSAEFQVLMNNVSGLPITYMGSLDHSEALAAIEKAYCVVVPSLWIENYPNSVLEAIACSTLVIGSNRGGIPELIGEQSLLFNPLDVNDISQCIRHVVSLTDSEYQAIVSRKQTEAKSNNNEKRYLAKMIDIANLPRNTFDEEQ